MDLELQIVTLLKEMTDQEVNKADYGSEFVNLGVDSVLLLELVMKVQDSFGIELEDHELMAKNMGSVEKLAAIVRRHLD